ncbi:MAG: phosphopentomutase [Clostridia bacterium]|nr:phosphopentomutase [Clostridia bacterium]
MIDRIFLIVLDSVGIGEQEDSYLYGDEGSNTLKSCYMQKGFSVPNMQKLGLFNIDGIDYADGTETPLGAYGRFKEKSKGKDTTTGHWEICGIISERALPTYPDGFPDEIIKEFSKRTGRGVLCNKPYSGTQVIEDYGKKHMETGDLIVYTSADSVFQIAAHEDIVPLPELYRYCEIAREILTGKHGVGRVIARPFEGEFPFKRTPNRHDYSLVPPETTLIDELTANGLDAIAVGKIYDIFAGKSFKESNPTKSNADGMAKTDAFFESDFKGLCFTNLVDFDMHYGHRNDAEGYAKALMEFDGWIGKFIEKLKDTDVVMITADHGCDPLTESTDHSREHVPLLVYGKKIKATNLGTRATFADIGKTIADLFGIDAKIKGESFKNLILKD